MSKFSDSDATRIIAALEARADRRAKDGSQVSSTWATVGAVDAANKTASAYLYGETDGAYMSEGFRIPETMYLTVGDKVKVAINYATGDRWVEEAHFPATAHKKVAFDIATGSVLLGDGSAAPDTRLARTATEELTISDAGGNDLAGRLVIKGHTRVERGGVASGALNAWVAGDTVERIQIKADGSTEWGNGSAARDVRLRRTAVATVEVDNAEGGDGAVLSVNGQVWIRTATSHGILIGDTLGQTTNLPFRISPTGFLEWGSGAAARDTNLYRAAANVLATDDAFYINGPVLRKGSLSRELKYDADGAAAASRFTVEATAGQEASIQFREVGDTSARTVLATTGLSFGPGNAATDTLLSRVSPNALGTGAGDDVRVGGAGAGDTATGLLLSATGRIEIAADGGTPYIDFKNDILGTDFDARIIWGGTNLQIAGAPLDIASGLVLKVAGTQVVTSRRTGWGAPTGTATRTTFATSTVTTAQLAERVKALIDDLTTHGLIGA